MGLRNNSWMLASIISLHGDDNGLVLPYTLAPVQVVIIPFRNDGGVGKGGVGVSGSVESAVEDIRAQLLKEYIDVKVDDSDKASLAQAVAVAESDVSKLTKKLYGKGYVTAAD